MTVSIVMAAYNAAQTIEEAIRSVLAQTSPAWELILVNDGSGDRTAEIAADFARQDRRIRVIDRPNGGESAARNTGIGQAAFDWLLFLDADDWISPFHLERLTAELEAHPELDAVHCGSVRVAHDGSTVADAYVPPVGDLFPTLARRAGFPVHACIVRKSLVDSVGQFDLSLRKSADWDLWQRIARTGARFGGVPEVLAYYRMQPNSASLDAEQLLYDGLRVLLRGHSPDPRVPSPKPEYSDGLPDDSVESQEFYLVCWCASLLLGSRKDPRHLLETVRGHRYEALYPEAVAQCLFEAATLPACQPREAWDELWPEVRDLVETFLAALEEHSGTPDLARTALIDLKKFVLKHSRTWGIVLSRYEQAAADQKASLERMQERIATLEQSLEAAKAALARQMAVRRSVPDRGWRLRTGSGNAAHLELLSDEADTVRIAIVQAATGAPWDIQLNRPRLAVTSSRRYAVSFRARADQARTIMAGFARAQAPWSGLGLYKEIALAPEWQSFREEFAPSADEHNARIHFDLGGSTASVELSEVELIPLAETQADEAGPLEPPTDSSEEPAAAGQLPE